MSLTEMHIERGLEFEYDLEIVAGAITGLYSMGNPEWNPHLLANGNRTIIVAHPMKKIFQDIRDLSEKFDEPREIGELYLKRSAEGGQHFEVLAILASQDHLQLDILRLTKTEIRGALWSGLDRRISAERAELTSHVLGSDITTIDSARRACLPKVSTSQAAAARLSSMLRLQNQLIAPVGNPVR
jgi:hypothetical protein